MTYLPTPSSQPIRYFYDPPGTAPGTLKQPNGQAPMPAELMLIDYSPTQTLRATLSQPEECTPYLDGDSITWLDVRGLRDLETLQRVGQVFELHPLILEDMVNVPQRSKVDSHGNQLVIITQMVTFLPAQGRYVAEQISFVLGQNYLLSVQAEAAYDCFDPIRDRIAFDRGLIRHMGADYLAYCLLDAIVDAFFPVLEAYGQQLEQLEDHVILRPSPKALQDIYQLRREMSGLRHLIWLQRDTLSGLLQEYSHFMSADLGIYLRDCYEHAVQLLDIVESYREACSALMDIYLSALSNRMNEVMKTLTVISTIFIPLTFIAGIYGMNFNPAASPLNMPELNWYWGYPFIWFVMVTLAMGLIFFFWRRGWFRSFL